MRALLSFAIGILFFLSVALAFSGFIAAHLPAPVDTEGIISRTYIAGYPKHLDGFCFNLGSVLIPGGAWLFWLFAGRKWKWPRIAVLSGVWLVIVLFVVLKQ